METDNKQPMVRIHYRSTITNATGNGNSMPFDKAVEMLNAKNKELAANNDYDTIHWIEFVHLASLNGRKIRVKDLDEIHTVKIVDGMICCAGTTHFPSYNNIEFL